MADFPITLSSESDSFTHKECIQPQTSMSTCIISKFLPFLPVSSSRGRFYGIMLTLCCCVCVHIYIVRLVIWQQVEKTRIMIHCHVRFIVLVFFFFVLFCILKI